MSEQRDTSLRVLVIDDTPDDRALVIRQLKRDFPAISVTEIIDGTGLEAAIEQCMFDLAITDYRLHWSDGITIVHALKTRCPNRPVIMFTNSGNEEIAVNAMKAGLDDYVVKSSKGFLGLASAVRMTVERQESRRTILQSEQELRRVNENLEKLVAERTSQLKAANATLEQDLIERNRMEKLLVRSHDFYLTLLEEFPTLIWRAGIDGKCDYFNKAWLKFRGCRLEEEIEGSCEKGIHLQDQDRYVQTFKEAFQARRPFVVEYRLHRHDGEYRWVMDSGAPFNDLDGHFAGYIGSCYDVHDGKRQREDLERIVEKRTKDLSQTNAELYDKVQELEQFHDVVIGRELKMIELEKKIVKLEEELKKAKPSTGDPT